MLYPILLLIILAVTSWGYSAFPGAPYGDWALTASFGLLVCAAIFAVIAVAIWFFRNVISGATGSP